MRKERMKIHGIRLKPGHTALIALFVILPMFFIQFTANASGADGPVSIPAKVFGVCHGYGENEDDFHKLIEQGVAITRNDIYWGNVEKEDGVFDFGGYDSFYKNINALGIESLGILDYGNPYVLGPEYGRRIPPDKIDKWIRYVNITVNRYKENVTYFEIWNEPNIEKFWNGTDDEFFYLLNKTANFIKDIDPNIKVIAPGISGHNPDYLDAMISYIGDDEFNRLFYALNFHPYSGKNAEIIIQKVKDVREVMEKHHYKGQLWITEVGVSTQVSSWDRVQEEYWDQWMDEADQLVKIYAETLSLGLDKVVWYCYRDWKNINWTYGEAAFGIQHYSEQYNQWIYKPAGYAYQFLSRRLSAGYAYPDAVSVVGTLGASSNSLYVYPFVTSRNTILLIIWSQNLADYARIFLNMEKCAQNPDETVVVDKFVYLDNRTISEEVSADMLDAEGYRVEISNVPVVLEFHIEGLTGSGGSHDLNADDFLPIVVRLENSPSHNLLVIGILLFFIPGIVSVVMKLNKSGKSGEVSG